MLTEIAMETVATLVVLLCAVMFLAYVRERGNQQLSGALRRGVAVSKYIIALFVATFGSGAIAALSALPLLVYARMGHSDSASALFSVLLDRPYFPLQTAVAFVVGFVSAKWLKEGKPVFVWVLPLLQFMAAAAILPSRYSAFESSAQFISTRFFNWGCGCSATLLQWELMFPLCTSVAFSVAAYVRSFTRSATPLPSQTGGTTG